MLFTSVALGNTGYIAAITVATLAARALTGSPMLAGTPGAVAVIGTAFGTWVLAADAARAGRRRGLVAGYAIAAIGAVAASIAVIMSSLLMLLAGLFVIGFGQSASQLARYAAADVAEDHKRGTSVSLIVWAGTIGAVLGPSLLEPAGGFAQGLDQAAYLGGYLVTATFMTAAFITQLIAFHPPPPRSGTVTIPRSVAVETRETARGFWDPRIQVALVSMIFGQVVMVLIMTGTPIHIEDTGRGLSIVGLVISAHTFGMFAFSPITGRLVDRHGPRVVLTAAVAILAVSAMVSAAAPDDQTWVLLVGLLLLGVGWNAGFVAGSSVLATAGTARLQGIVDSTVWVSSAAASLSSGVLLQFVGYPALSLAGLALLVAPTTMLAVRGRRAVFAV